MMFDTLRKQFIDAYHGRYDPEYVQLMATVYWRTLLAITIPVLIAIFVYASWQFSNVQEELASDASATIPVQTQVSDGDRTRLRTTLDAVNARQSVYDALKTGGPTIPDPSR